MYTTDNHFYSKKNELPFSCSDLWLCGWALSSKLLSTGHWRLLRHWTHFTCERSWTGPNVISDICTVNKAPQCWNTSSSPAFHLWKPGFKSLLGQYNKFWPQFTSQNHIKKSKLLQMSSALLFTIILCCSRVCCSNIEFLLYLDNLQVPDWTALLIQIKSIT